MWKYLGNNAQFGKSQWRGIFPQPKVWKTEEYLVYFLFSKLRGWGKRPAIRPQTQLCGVALICDSFYFQIKTSQAFRSHLRKLRCLIRWASARLHVALNRTPSRGQWNTIRIMCRCTALRRCENRGFRTLCAKSTSVQNSRFFNAAISNCRCFSMGVRMPGFRCTRQLL